MNDITHLLHRSCDYVVLTCQMMLCVPPWTRCHLTIGKQSFATIMDAVVLVDMKRFALT